jgi:hypothetical protein
VLTRSSGEEVVKAWREAAAELGKTFGENHYLAVKAKRRLAQSIYASYAAADPGFAECARLHEEGTRAGPEWERNLSRFDLARALMRMKRDAEAEKYLRLALARFKREPPDLFAGHEPHALQLLAMLADRSGDPKKKPEVENLLKMAVDAVRINKATPAGRRGIALRDLGHIRLVRNQDFISTAALFAESAESFRQLKTADRDLRCAQSLAYQAIVVRASGDVGAADRLRRAAEQLARPHVTDGGRLAQEVRRLLKGETPAWPGA